MTRTLLVTWLCLAIVACGSRAPSGGPTGSPAVMASPTPTPTPTVAPPSPIPDQRFTNPVLGYAVTLPQPWRVTDCLSRLETRDPVFLGQDVVTWRTVADEQDLGVTSGTGASGAFSWVIVILVQTSSQTSAEYAAARAAGSGGRIESTTIDGKPATRSLDAAGKVTAYSLANAGRMYDIQLTPGLEVRPRAVTDAAFAAVAQSITFTPPTARPVPTPPPAVTGAVQAVADAVADAFAASDAARLRDLMTPKCWFNSGYSGSEGSAASRDKVATSLRSSFAEGLKVTVEPRPIRTAPPLPGAFWIWSRWSGYGTNPPSNVQLVFDRVDDRWYLSGALFNAPR